MAQFPARPRRRSSSLLPLTVLLAALCSAIPTAQSPLWAARPPEEAPWPQEFKVDGTKLVFYQPQWDALEQDVLSGRSAIAITTQGRTTPVFGAAWIEAEVDVDREKGTVEAHKVRIMKVHLPDSTPGEEGRLLEQARKITKDLEIETGLETLTRSLEATRDERTLAENLNMNAPRILFEKTPTILVVLDGDPKTVKVKETSLERVVNTPSFLVRDTDNKKFYLQSAGSWYEAKAVKGPWRAIDSPPSDVRKLYESGTETAKTNAQGDEAKNAESKPAPKGPPPAVIVATEPTELIVTDGEPKFNPIAGGDLLYLSNTPSDVLMDVASQKYYVLLSGRWYRTVDMTTGPWEYVRANDLPDAFLKIPAGSAKGDVLASVAGTPQAEEAVEDAQVPQTAAVRRDEAQLSVEYDGQPQFKKIPSTDVQYAVNTTTQVLLINGKYYAVDQGVWFIADSPEGPWALCDEVPQEVRLRIAGNSLLRIEQAQGGGRDDRLLQGNTGKLLRTRQVSVGIGPVAERTRGEAGQLPDVTIRELDDHAIGGEVFKTMDRVGGEAGFRLLAVGDYRGPGGLELPDRILERVVDQLVHRALGNASGGEILHSLNQLFGSRNASDGLGGYQHAHQTRPNARALSSRRIHRANDVRIHRRVLHEGRRMPCGRPAPLSPS